MELTVVPLLLSLVAAPDPTLVDLARLYRTGQADRALAAVTGWGRERVEAETKRLRSGENPPTAARARQLTPAAALLLADSGLLDITTGDLDGMRWKLRHAESLVHDRPESVSTLFARRFHLLVGLALHAVSDLNAAHAKLSEGVHRFDADPELLVALGSISEALAGLRRYSVSPLERRPRQRVLGDCFEVEGVAVHVDCLVREAIEVTEGRYVRALALAPELHEARLRLGRVRLLRGHVRDAVAELGRVASASRDPRQRYLARLFEGRAREQLGDIAGAAAAYEAAAGEVEHGQSALVALGRAFDLLGEHAGAQEAFARAIRATESQDPWWLYFNGQPHRLGSLLMELRGLLP